MHVTAFGLHRLEATAPWGVKQEKRAEEKVTPSGKKIFPTDLAHFSMLSRCDYWLRVEGIAEPIPIAFKLCGELLCELSGTSPRIGGAVSGLPDDQILASCFHDIH